MASVIIKPSFKLRSTSALCSSLALQAGDSVPDGKTIWDFKQLLEKDSRGGARKLFESFTKLLEEQGMIARGGSIVDANFVDAPRHRIDELEGLIRKIEVNSSIAIGTVAQINHGEIHG